MLILKLIFTQFSIFLQIVQVDWDTFCIQLNIFTEIIMPCSSTLNLKLPGGYLVTVLPIPLVLEDSCQSKVGNLQVAGGADEKVGRLQILELYTLHY